MGVEIVEVQEEQKCLKEENKQLNTEVTIHSSKAEVEESFRFSAEKLRQILAEKVELDQQLKAVVEKNCK